MKTIYEDRTVPLYQLFEVNDQLKQTTTLMFEAAARGRAGKPLGDIPGRIMKSTERAGRYWSEYLATYLTPEEERVAHSFELKKREFLELGVMPGLKLIEMGRCDELESFATDKSIDAFSKARTEMESLIKIQVDVAKQEFDTAQAQFTWVFAGIICVLTTALLAGLALGWRTMVAVGKPLRRLKEAMDQIQFGNYNSRILIERDDELGLALRDVQAMQAKLGVDREEQRARRRLAEEEKREAL
jgi:methyl-accepting chemotaxis protein